MDIEITRADHAEHALALDRRSVDRDGRMIVTDCVLTTASVCPYIGREIPDFDKLGLDPEHVYQLYRDPAALKAAVASFDNQPLLADHVPVSAEQPQQQMIVGTIGDARWSEGKVIGTVTVWDADAIRAIVSNERRDLSVGYYYTPDMTSGRTPSGEEFDGRMRGPIVVNHVALVTQGRVPSAMVADRALRRRPGHVVTVDTVTALRLAAEQRTQRSPADNLIPHLHRLP